MGKRLYNGEFSFLPMQLLLTVKNQSKLLRSLLVGGQCLGGITQVKFSCWTKCNFIRMDQAYSTK